MRNEVYEAIISEVKEKAPDFYRILMLDLAPFEDHHYYHAKILDSFRRSLSSGFLSEQFSYTIQLLLDEYRKFVHAELLGTWTGTEDEKAEFTLQLNSVNDFIVKRSWTERIDGETYNEYQEFNSLGSKMLECDELVVLNLFACEKRITKIKLALMPAIAFHKKLIGSMFWYQDDICTSYTRVNLDKAENGT
jgi:hypothetical protein